ncbi:hypothetical protein M758_11G082700 [Ceratodon purpureus]|uniref:Uncharacterized protein n=1 Tax=Ceratodon purpureus TaxID=3225 RepID=A0A8T0GEE9_CERPU|nr:hypothetical protein KC19_11G085800 [Ceratodon purpureus]KAG0601084.1 hypothetical protein M758_11G082700 [Ceratodon purpureus]
MAAMMKLNAAVALPSTGISAVPLSSSTSSRVNSSGRLALRPLVVVRAESNPASGGTTDKAGYAQTNAGGSGAPNPGAFANDVVEGVSDKVDDAQKGAENLGSETKENLGNVGKELKDGVAELADDTKNIVNKATSSNPGHGN